MDYKKMWNTLKAESGYRMSVPPTPPEPREFKEGEKPPKRPEQY